METIIPLSEHAKHRLIAIHGEVSDLDARLSRERAMKIAALENARDLLDSLLQDKLSSSDTLSLTERESLREAKVNIKMADSLISQTERDRLLLFEEQNKITKAMVFITDKDGFTQDEAR